MIYAIGDIHGEITLLENLYNKIILDIEEEENTIVFLGDYIDRGTGSLKVIEFLQGLKDTDRIKHIFLCGNHEIMFVEAIDYPYDKFGVDFWLKYGGQAVLDEAGMDFHEFCQKYPHQKIRRWIKDDLLMYYETDDFVFVHGGLDIRRDICSQTPDYLLWARHTTEDYYENYKKMVIHGHTSYSKPFIDKNRICIDTSYHATKKILTSVVLKDKKTKPRFLTTDRELYD